MELDLDSKNEKLNQIVRNKMREFLARAEALKKDLSKELSQQQAKKKDEEKKGGKDVPAL